MRVLRERWKVVALLLLLGIGISAVITALSPKEYTATAQVYVASSAQQSDTATGAYAGGAAAASQAQTFAALIDSKDILHQVISRSNLALTPAQLKGKLSATAPTAQALVDVSATDGSPTVAAELANYAAAAFKDYIEKINTTSTSQGSNFNLTVALPATAPGSPSSPSPVLNIALGVVLGLLFGIALAVARDILDNRIKDVEELSKVSGKPAMGAIVEDPKASRHPIATRAGTRNARAENFRQLRANLQFANVDEHPRIIAITSSVPTEGKTMVAMNLASTLAEAGFTVCLVDADLRRPTVAKVMGLLGPVGLTSVLIHQIDLDDALQKAGSNLYVLSSGPTPPNPSEVLASSYVRDIVHSLLDRVDYVVIDTAPLLPVADGSEVAALADGTLLVASHNMTTDVQIKRAIATLNRVDARLLGVVLNRIPIRRAGEYGYAYYRAEPTAPVSPAKHGGRRGRAGRDEKADAAVR
jgi:capsular exopolysaccharide synthesis family protein